MKTINEIELEKAIRKSSKVLKEKLVSIKAREKRQLNIKEKKYMPKLIDNDDEE